MTSHKEVVHSSSNDQGQELPSLVPFQLNEGDLLVISLTVNVCLFLQVPVGRLVGYLLTRDGGVRFKFISTVIQLYPCLLGKLLMEIIVLLIIVLLTIYETFHTKVQPFTQDPLFPPDRRLRLIFGLTIGRFLVIASNILFISEPHGTRSLTGQTEKPTFDFVYCVISIVSNVISLGYGENHLIVLTSSFMELNCIHLACRRLLNLGKRRTMSRPSVKTILLCGVVCSITRIILPMIFLGLAISKESPLHMSTIPFIWFGFCCIFYGSFHAFLLHQCTRQVVEVLSCPVSSLHRSIPTSLALERTNDHANSLPSNRPHFAILDSSEYFFNNLHASSDKAKKPIDDDEKPLTYRDWLVKSWTKTLNDVNYGFLHSYANKNLCSSHSHSQLTRLDDTVNIGHKKNTCRDELFDKPVRVMRLTDTNTMTEEQQQQLETPEKPSAKNETGSLLSEMAVNYAGDDLRCVDDAEDTDATEDSDDDVTEDISIICESRQGEDLRRLEQTKSRRLT